MLLASLSFQVPCLLCSGHHATNGGLRYMDLLHRWIKLSLLLWCAYQKTRRTATWPTWSRRWRWWRSLVAIETSLTFSDAARRTVRCLTRLSHTTVSIAKSQSYISHNRDDMASNVKKSTDGSKKWKLWCGKRVVMFRLKPFTMYKSFVNNIWWHFWHLSLGWQIFKKLIELFATCCACL